MAKYSKLEVLNQIKNIGLVPLFYHDNVEVAQQVVTACYHGGARILEFTNRGDFAQEIFGQLNKYCLKNLPGMMLGAGSIPDAPTAAMFMQLGAHFIVTPSLRKDVALICNRRNIPWSAGCGSLTEIGQAEELGCDLVKLFPGSTYGPPFVKSIKAPQPWTNVMPTGGVSPTEENLSAWFNAGVFCVGMGSKLITKKDVTDQNWTAIEKRTKAAIQLISQLKNN